MTDTEIIHNVLQGDQRAYKWIVEKYSPMLFRVVMGFVHNQEQAEELVQDTFVKAYQSLAAFNHKSSLSTWLYRIAINQSINYLRGKKIKHFWTSLPLGFSGRAAGPDPLSQMEQQEQSHLIRRAMDSLPEKQRTAFILSKYEDLSQKEIASVLKTSEGAVEQLLQRAKAGLRKKLGKP